MSSRTRPRSVGAAHLVTVGRGADADDQPSLSQTRIVSSMRRPWTAAPVGGTMVRCRKGISMSTLLQIGPVN